MILLIAGFAAIALAHLPGLLRQRQWRELAAFVVLLTGGFVLSVLITLKAPVPPLTTSLHDLIKSLLHLSDSFGMP